MPGTTWYDSTCSGGWVSGGMNRRRCLVQAAWPPVELACAMPARQASLERAHIALVPYAKQHTFRVQQGLVGEQRLLGDVHGAEHLGKGIVCSGRRSRQRGTGEQQLARCCSARPAVACLQLEPPYAGALSSTLCSRLTIGGEHGGLELGIRQRLQDGRVGGQHSL